MRGVSPEYQRYLDEAFEEGLEILARYRQEHGLDGPGEAPSLWPIAEEGGTPTACTALILRPSMALAPLHHIDYTKKELIASIHVKYENVGLVPLRFRSLSNRFEAYEFQKEGVQFIKATNYKCLIGDKMGLGKTVQALLALANDPNGDKLPTLYIVRSSTSWQWLLMHKEWMSSNPLGVYMIRGSKAFIPSGFSAYVVSMDTLGKLVTWETDRTGQIIEGSAKLNRWIEEIGFKSVVVDECHSFKNVEARRSQALEIFLQLTGIKYEIYLSGTAIKNRADEYYFTLHRLFPDLFPNRDTFRAQWCEKDEKGKYSRIKPWRLEAFRARIAMRVLRREKGIDLPPFRRTTTVVSIENPKFKEQYNRALDDLQEVYQSKSKISFNDVRDNLMVLRQIVGNAKVDDAVDYVDEFIDENEDDKIVVGVHHHSVRDILYAKLIARGHAPLKLSGEDSAESKNYIVQKFKEKTNRILIISILAGGTGIDGLQCCANVLFLERQWNCADEEQFEFRFNRDGQKNPVTCDYMIAHGTVDDYFTKNVERTRRIFGETVGNNWRIEDDEQSIEDLVQETLRNRL